MTRRTYPPDIEKLIEEEIDRLIRTNPTCISRPCVAPTLPGRSLCEGWQTHPYDRDSVWRDKAIANITPKITYDQVWE